MFVDGHDLPTGRVLVWSPVGGPPVEARLRPLVNDRWAADVTLDAVGRWTFGVEAWVDHLGTWRRDTLTKLRAGIDVTVELEMGARLLESAPTAPDLPLAGFAEHVRALRGQPVEHVEAGLDDASLVDAVARQAPGEHAVRTAVFPLTVDPRQARFSAWYELFPRSASPDPGGHGTLADVVDRLPYDRRAWASTSSTCRRSTRSARSDRKGPNNTLTPGPTTRAARGPSARPRAATRPSTPSSAPTADVATWSPRPRGARASRSRSTSPSSARPTTRGSPSTRPGSGTRPDGTIQYAENPPKKYQDIYPLDFETDDWPGLWEALRGVVRLWIDAGVRIFRVDNPHTKPFAFWEWVIAEVKRRRPRRALPGRGLHPAQGDAPPGQGRLHPVVHLLHLAHHGVGAAGVLHRAHARRRRPSTSGPTSGRTRPTSSPSSCSTAAGRRSSTGLVLAATLAASYGIYGPAFELREGERRASPAARSTCDSEKYQVRHWDRDRPDSLAPLLAPAQRASAGRTRRCSTTARCGSTPTDNDAAALLLARLAPTAAATWCWRSSTSTPTTRQAGVVHARPRRRSASAAGEPFDGARPARRRPATPGRAPATSSSSTPRARRPTSSRLDAREASA